MFVWRLTRHQIVHNMFFIDVNVLADVKAKFFYGEIGDFTSLLKWK